MADRHLRGIVGGSEMNDIGYTICGICLAGLLVAVVWGLFTLIGRIAG
jgi:hypothetical protein